MKNNILFLLALGLGICTPALCMDKNEKPYPNYEFTVEDFEKHREWAASYAKYKAELPEMLKKLELQEEQRMLDDRENISFDDEEAELAKRELRELEEQVKRLEQADEEELKKCALELAKQNEEYELESRKQAEEMERELLEELEKKAMLEEENFDVKSLLIDIDQLAIDLKQEEDNK